MSTLAEQLIEAINQKVWDTDKELPGGRLSFREENIIRVLSERIHALEEAVCSSVALCTLAMKEIAGEKLSAEEEQTVDKAAATINALADKVLL